MFRDLMSRKIVDQWNLVRTLQPDTCLFSDAGPDVRWQLPAGAWKSRDYDEDFVCV